MAASASSLATAGYRVWVPDQRGYNLSDKPPGIAAYRLEALAADVIGLIAAGQQKAHLAGHDGGGVVAWWLASPWIPELVTRLANWRLLVRTLQQSSRPGTFTTADPERYRQTWAQPQAFHAMPNWYRAVVRKPPRLPVHHPSPCPPC